MPSTLQTTKADRRPRQPKATAEARFGNGYTTLTLGAVVGVVTLVAELLYRLPPLPSDQLNYLDAARMFPEVPTTFYHTITMRTGIVLPLRLMMTFFGYTEATYYLVAMAAGVALAVAVFALGVLLFNSTVGTAAAALTVGNSVVFPDLTQPLVDPLATALFCWALVLAVAIRQRRPQTSATQRRETITLIVIGALLGWSYLTREFIVFVWPLVPLVLFRRVALRRMLWIALPVAATGLGEAALNAWIYGNPLERLTASSGHGAVLAEQAYGVKQQHRNPEYLLTRFVAAIGKTPEGMFLKAALLVTIAGAIRSRRLRFLAAWFALLWVPLTLLGGLLDPARPTLTLTIARFWLPIIPAICLGGVGAIYLLVRQEARRYARLATHATAIAACAALLGTAVPVGVAQLGRLNDPAYVRNHGDDLGRLKTWLAKESQQVRVLRSDPKTSRVLAVSTRGAFGEDGWDGAIEPLKSAAEARPGEYVVLYWAADVCSQCQAYAARTFGWKPSIPPAWVQVFRTSDEGIRVYRVP
jgi:4-amino-4-deoxy-L-arabinose transferase-like glycosyltransferase